MARVKIYEGSNLMELYERIKREHPNGKILSTEKIEKRKFLFFKKFYYKVLVEVDENIFSTKERAKEILSILEKDKKENQEEESASVLSFVENKEKDSFRNSLKNKESISLKDNFILEDLQKNNETIESSISTFEKSKFYEESKQAEITKKEKNYIDKRSSTEVLEEKLDSMSRLLKELVDVIKKSQLESSPKNPFIRPSLNLEELEDLEGDARKLAEFLIERGIEPDIAKSLVLVSCGLNMETGKYDLSIPSRKEVILKGLEKYIKFTGPIKIEEGKRKIVAFVGPTGVGKTTNLIKLASYYALDEGKKVAIINADTFKIGAQDQIRIYSRILNVPYKTVSDAIKLKEALKEFHDYDLIFIDTVGRSHYDHWKLGEIKATLALEESMDIFLVLSCSMKDLELYEATKRFSRIFPITALFFTKIDECLTPGSIVNVPFRYSYPLSYISTGQRVPEDIKVLNPETLTEIILGEE